MLSTTLDASVRISGTGSAAAVAWGGVIVFVGDAGLGGVGGLIGALSVGNTDVGIHLTINGLVEFDAAETVMLHFNW